MLDATESAVDWPAIAAGLATYPRGAWREAVADASVRDFLDARAAGLLTHHGNMTPRRGSAMALCVCLPKPLPRDEPLDTSSEFHSDWNTYEIDEEFRAFRIGVLRGRLERAPRRLAKSFGELLCAAGTDQIDDARERHEELTDDIMKSAHIYRAELALLLELGPNDEIALSLVTPYQRDL